MAIPKGAGIPVATKDMKFKYICKYCQKGGLAWKVIDHKWMLFDTLEAAHVCQEKKEVVANQISNLTKTKSAKAKPGLKEHFQKLNEAEKAKAAKKIIDKIKEGDTPIKAMADNPKGSTPANPILKVTDGMPLSPIDELLAEKKALSTGEFLKDKQESDSKKTNPKSKESKVKLKDAKELYQPVFGSSKSSTYYVVALYDGLKFAARVKGGGQSRTVSIRVEGKAYAKLKGMSGLQKFNDNGAYGSIHLNVETVYEAKMVICGLIGGIDMEATTLMPDLTNIAK